MLLVASVRDARVGRAVADWVAARAAMSFDVDLIDLAEVDLPEDRLLQPGGGVPTPITDRIAGADGYLVVTPEYNHSYPASLKQAIDWHYGEWMFKAATVVSYGAQGGWLATEHLRGVFTELHVVTTRRGLGLRAPWTHLQEGVFAPPEGAGEELGGALVELEWWTRALRHARAEHPLPR
ncbi:NADPH-dependent FMN reductase [Kineococcus arenarius]|uniref:NADPH-dependent FMN reductase n=1 Tax=unclassified Kineococcus TaxID=2621656 RepID=UPI003D7E620E